MRRIKTSEVASTRAAILKAQGYKCALCGASLKSGAKKDPVLDHCHTNGHLRGVLCRNCNQMEGKVKTSATRAVGAVRAKDWLRSLVDYLDRHEEPQVPLLHPTHKTEEEKRLARNKKARERRAKLKAMQNK